MKRAEPSHTDSITGNIAVGVHSKEKSRQYSTYRVLGTCSKTNLNNFGKMFYNIFYKLLLMITNLLKLLNNVFHSNQGKVFKNYLNQIYPKIKFTIEVIGQIPFLDLPAN